MSKAGPPVPFSSLPLNKENEAAKLNAWGAYGADDELGFLNRQTSDVVAAAASSEIKTGIRVALDATLDFQGEKPLFSRQIFRKDVYQKKPRIVHDDQWHFNTQSSTQWDGLRHFGYQKAQRFYNDTTVEDIAGTSDKGKSRPDILGIQNMAKRGGIVGRGILVDFQRWIDECPGAKDKVQTESRDNQGYHPMQRTGIKLGWIQEVLKWQGTEVKWADVLIIRSGFMKAYQSIDAQVLETLYGNTPPTVGGVEATEELLEWIWNNFSAVGGDQPGFEEIPMRPDWALHEVLLGGWGCPIGELFDLEELSVVCQEQKRWSFFLSSQVTHVPGGVASPPNAIAIF